MNEWKWSKGEVYYKSGRIKREFNKNEEIENEISEREINENAIKQSLEGFNDLKYENILFDPKFSRNDNLNGNRREDLDCKISERELLFQRGTNPFLSNTDYVNDIEIRDNFLKPKNTTSDKIINNN